MASGRPFSAIAVLLSALETRRKAKTGLLKCDSNDSTASGPSSPCAGARKTRVQRKTVLSEGHALEAFALEVATAAATDLATYWSNSVRPYALRGSPFLRPPVFAALTRLDADFYPSKVTT